MYTSLCLNISIVSIEQFNDTSVEYKGTVFSGEAPESDDEILAFSNVQLTNAKEVTETFNPFDSKPSNKNKANLSLLQQCLGKNNLNHRNNKCL